MLDQIKGLHHVTSMARDARENNEFFTGRLGLRRVKKTVNFDAPDVYHLYYGDESGTPGSVMTYFPFPNIGKGRPGVGEVGTTVFAVPEGTLPSGKAARGAGRIRPRAETSFGENRLASRVPMATASRWSRARTITARRGPRAVSRRTRRYAASIPPRSGCGTAAPRKSC